MTKAPGMRERSRGQGFRDAVGEIVLPGVAAEIGEGQDDEREPRRPGRFSQLRRMEILSGGA